VKVRTLDNPKARTPQASAHRSSWARSLAVLAGLSGVCGLAYEILYIRLFTNVFGDSFAVTGVTLCAIFLGMSLGAWQSQRFLRHLAGIEIAIGLYAMAAGFAFSNWGFEIAAFERNSWGTVVKLIVFLGSPAFLIGTCVPLFAAYARTARGTDGGVFPRIYGLYNLGALASVLAIEFVLFRSLGLQITIYIIGLLNLIIGGVLLLRYRSPRAVARQTIKVSIKWRIAWVLFLASFASGVFQLFMLQLSFSVFGPLHENFALILASAIAGVAIGSWLAARRLIRFEDAPYWLALLMLILLVFVPALISVWSALANWPFGDLGELFAKALLLAGFPLPLFILFGTLVPLAVAAHGDTGSRLPGHLLAVSSLGNGLGALTMFSILHSTFTLPQIGIGLAGLLLMAGLVAAGQRPRLSQALKGAVVAAALGFAGLQNWPYVELLLGYRSLAQPEQLDRQLRDFEEATTYKAYDQTASILSFRDGARSLVFNGYHSLSFGPGGKSDLHETIVGATPALFAKQTNNAIVLGLGTGISAGATARLFDHTDIVEINPAILKIPKHFERENKDVLSRQNTNVILQDAISVMLGSGPQYDAIVNTVTSPKYYAASKLYTMEFLALAKARLTDRGVYSTWFDLNIDHNGIATMLNTLEASFAKCRYFVLTESYFNAVCADHPLIYQSSLVTRARFEGQGFGALLEQHGFTRGFTATLSALEVSFEPAFFDRDTAPLNTLDRPVIEFEVARNSDKLATSQALSDVLVANIDRQRRLPGPKTAWKEYCQTIARMSYLDFQGCD
jgi:predicted membrane-bound spermidine synthase